MYSVFLLLTLTRGSLKGSTLVLVQTMPFQDGVYVSRGTQEGPRAGRRGEEGTATQRGLNEGFI